MSIIQSIKQVLGLSGTASENHFWDGSVPNQLSLKRGTPAAPGAELIKALNGALSFPNQGQSLATNGYVKLPGGLIVQWGAADLAANGVQTDIPLPIAWPTKLLSVSVTLYGSSPAGSVSMSPASGLPLTYMFGYNSNPTTRTVYWIALGH